MPIAAVGRNERLRLYPTSRYARVIADTLRAAPGVRREYRSLLAQAFSRPVDLAGRVGMALNPTPEGLERELELLAGLGRIPAFVRFYHHEGPEHFHHRAPSGHRTTRSVCSSISRSRKGV